VNEPLPVSHAALLTHRLVDHDPTVVDHAARVTDLALRLATELDAGQLLLRRLALATPLHDIGKLEIDPAILAKPGPLDDDEFEAIRAHPVAGTRILEGIQSLRAALGTVLHHHERWDGGGYPHGIERTEIPEDARIVAVADAYDAMISDRPYSERVSHADALAEIERCSGTQFEPRVAEAFVRMIS
jgi:HD-GYP domain-containing protein (c-di-GMP phosphodiesterase class II)